MYASTQADIADWDKEHQFMNGSAAVAMLVGADAPLVVAPERATHMIHEWDFYKPYDWPSPHPVMPSGAASVEAYEKCLRNCAQGLREQLHVEKLNDVCDYFVFHSTSTYLCKRGWAELCKGDFGNGMALAQRNQLFEQKVELGCASAAKWDQHTVPPCT